MKKGGGDNRTQAATPADTHSRIPAGTTKQQKNKNGQRRKTKKSEAKTPKLFGEGMGDGGLCQNYLS